jgi:hypothetical protein
MCLKKYCCIAAKLRSSRASSSQQRASSAKDWMLNPIRAVCHSRRQLFANAAIAASRVAS